MIFASTTATKFALDFSLVFKTNLKAMGTSTGQGAQYQDTLRFHMRVFMVQGDFTNVGTKCIYSQCSFIHALQHARSTLSLQTKPRRSSRSLPYLDVDNLALGGHCP